MIKGAVESSEIPPQIKAAFVVGEFLAQLDP
jgi:hypothetical protein